MKELNLIKVVAGPDGLWYARYDGPHREEIQKLFATSTLPTAFTTAWPKTEVVQEVQVKNPECVVF